SRISTERAVVHVKPRFLLTVSCVDSNLPDTLCVNGKNYPIDSPMRKGDNSAENPDGLIRTATGKIVETLASMWAQPILVMVDAEGLSSSLQSIVEATTAAAENLLLSCSQNSSDTLEWFTPAEPS